MSPIRRRSFAAVLLAAALAVATAGPVLAAPTEPAGFSVATWIADWLGRLTGADAPRRSAATETHPTMDPDGGDGAPTLSPSDLDSNTATTPPESDGETHPTMDPNG